MQAESSKYPNLFVRSGDVRVDFRDGVAEVSEAEATALRRLPSALGVSVPEVKRGRGQKAAKSD